MHPDSATSPHEAPTPPPAASPHEQVAPAPPVVRLSGAEKTFANGTRALAPLDLTVAPGELVSLVGPSGCGKSTAFRLIAGLADATAGEVETMGGPPVRARRDGGLAYVFQDPTLLPWASVRDNVALPLTLQRASRRERAAAAERALELVGLRGHAGDLPRQLSGGMRMRVSIARALVAGPRLLLMDEPFGALDEITRQALQDELLQLWRSEAGMTVLFVTHNVFEAAYLSTRVLVMSPRPGRVVADLAAPHAHPRADAFRAAPEFAQLVGAISGALRDAAPRDGGAAP